MKEITIKVSADELTDIVAALNYRATRYAEQASYYGNDVYEQVAETCDNLCDKLNAIFYAETETETGPETVDEYTLNLLTAIDALKIAKEKSPSVNENETLDEMLSTLTIMYNA